MFALDINSFCLFKSIDEKERENIHRSNKQIHCNCGKIIYLFFGVMGLCFSMGFYLVIEFWSQFKFAEDGISLCSDLPLLVVVSWETDAAETSSTDGEGANLF